MIYSNEYQQIRRVLKKDVRAVLALIRQSVDSAELVKRTRSTIEKTLSDYYLFEIDKNPVACVALHSYPDQNKGELACLYVRPTHENQGIGRSEEKELKQLKVKLSTAGPSSASSAAADEPIGDIDFPRVLPMIYLPAAGKNTTRAEDTPRCS